VDRACALGGGTTPPTVADATLEAELARTGYSSSSMTILPENEDYAAKLTTSYEFPQGSLTGQPINEVGIFPTTGSSLLWSRFVLPDPLTLLADESLQVDYSIYSYVNLLPVDGAYSYDGVDYTITVQPADVDNVGHRGYRGFLGIRIFSDTAGNSVAPKVAETDVLPIITDGPVGGTNSSTYVRDAYVPNSKELTGHADWYQSVGNFGTGIGMVTLYTSVGTWHLRFSPKIAKDTTKHLTLGFKITWGRKT
jgi:hypothetical protein